VKHRKLRLRVVGVALALYGIVGIIVFVILRMMEGNIILQNG